MGSCAAPSAKGDDKFITTDYLQQCHLLYVDVAKGYGTGLLVSRASYEAEKSILRHILEGKEAVTPL
ncbi:hypothetical protein OV430_25670, partial [Salmonella enterica subsp. enterica serovar 1,4,[5],12:i:-]|nr:hypothetical protein [Salmonella enterica subsp. enterica serovar 1,4,[5],12:i:-]